MFIPIWVLLIIFMGFIYFMVHLLSIMDRQKREYHYEIINAIEKNTSEITRELRSIYLVTNKNARETSTNEVWQDE